MNRIILKILATFFIAILGQQAHAANDYVIAQGYFEDATNHLTFEEVKTKNFTPFKDILTQGYSHSTFWLKLRIKGGQINEVGDSLVLRLRPSYTDEIELFDPLDQNKSMKRRLTGDTYAWSHDEYQSLNLNFKIKKTALDRDIYLRVKSAHTYMLHAEAVDLSTAEASDRKLELIYFAYLGFLVILFVWLISAWSLNKEKVLGLFSITQLAAIFYAAAMFGFFRAIFDDVISPHHLNDVTNYLIVSYVGIALYSHVNLLSEYGVKKSFKWILWIFLLVPIFSFILIALGYVTSGLQLNATSLIFATTFLAITTYYGFDSNAVNPVGAVLPKSFIKAYYTLLLLILLVTLLPMMGLIKAVEFSLHALFIHGLLSGLMLFSLLQYRAKKISEMQLERILVESSKAQQEQIRREDQGRLVGMLTHELKNSLAVVDLAVSLISSKLKGDSPSLDKNLINISKAMDDINLVIARCIDVDRLDQEKIYVSKKNTNLADFFRELALEMQGANRLHWDCNQNICINLDPDLLKVIVVNLIDNAIKYGEADSPIYIQVISDNLKIAISVKNQVGYSGLPDQTKLFEKYYRSEKAQKNRGTGLGLWLSRSIAHLINAELTYEAKDDVINFSIVWAQDGQ